jgi:hypothetical protein
MAAREFMLRSALSARRLTAVSAMAVALSTISLAAIPAAQAAPTGPSARIAAPAGKQLLPAKSVSCRIFVTLRFPHPIASVGQVRCSHRVPRITMLVRLIRNGITIRSHVFSKSFVSSIAGAVSIRCRRGFYQAKVNARVRLLSGRVLTGAAHTRTIRVRC